MKRIGVCLLLALVLASCTTLDLDTKNDVVPTSKEPKAQEPLAKPEELVIQAIQAEVDLEKKIVYVERPIYIPQPDAASPGAKPISGLDGVKSSVEQGIVQPRDYSHAACVYDYHADQVYEVYAQKDLNTDLCLEPGEIPHGPPIISDSEQWQVGANVSQDKGRAVQHVYVKPKTSGLVATLTINTDRRVYHIILRSYNTVYMPIVRWRYFPAVPNVYVSDLAPSVTADAVLQTVDPRYLSFDYTVRFNAANKPRWVPSRVYDDGRMTYLLFGPEVLQQEMPGVFEGGSEITNYRVHGNLVIIDKTIERVTLRYQNKWVTIEKKKALK